MTSSGPAPIDPRGPRTNQAVLALVLLVGLLTDQRWVVPLFAVVLFLGAAFGPKWGPVLRAYQVLIRPRLAPPTVLEDPRPPRFAATVGVLFLVASTVAFLLGATGWGWALAAIVAALAGLAAVTGLCVGCEMYVLLIRLRGGVRVVTVDRERAPSHGGDVRHGQFPDLPADRALDGSGWIVFTTEYCAVCPSVVTAIEAARPDDQVVVLDVADALELASRYRVRRAPTVLRVTEGRRVVARLAGADAVRRELDGETERDSANGSDAPADVERNARSSV